MKLLLGLMILTTGLCWGFSADSIQAAELRGRIGLSVMEFGYKEFSDDGHRVDRENGLLPGISAALTRTQGDWFVSGEVSYFAGDVRYDGRTQTGAPFETRTGENLLDYGLRAGRWFGMRADSDLAVYAGLGRRRWTRNIQSHSNVNGLFEVYDWWYGSLGTKWIFYKAGKLEGGIDLSLLRTLAPEIKIDFNGVYDNVRLDLGERFGGRLSFPWRYHYHDETAFLLEPYLEGWDLGRSSSKPLIRNGTVMGSVLEPRSETQNYGLAISLVRSF
ncbi:MAG: hypothetical protein HY283_02610 [Nitrospirae bacterium]|nr:hypothetical protein [Nitrospirota bacterium]